MNASPDRSGVTTGWGKASTGSRRTSKRSASAAMTRAMRLVAVFRLPVLRSSKWLRIAAEQALERSAFNVRPFLGIPKGVQPGDARVRPGGLRVPRAGLPAA
jgi:hypothetical protein